MPLAELELQVHILYVLMPWGNGSYPEWPMRFGAEIEMQRGGVFHTQGDALGLRRDHGFAIC
jgi:hypothetical protein